MDSYEAMIIVSIVIDGDFGVGSEKGGEAFNEILGRKMSSFGIRTSTFDEVFRFLFYSLVTIKEDVVVYRDIKNRRDSIGCG